jgi:hypothetical protein
VRVAYEHARDCLDEPVSIRQLSASFRLHRDKVAELARSERGLVARGQVEAAMVETQRQTGGLFDLLFACPHHPQAKDPAMARCWCRKPSAGAVAQAAFALAAMFPGETYPGSPGPVRGGSSGGRGVRQERRAGLPGREGLAGGGVMSDNSKIEWTDPVRGALLVLAAELEDRQWHCQPGTSGVAAYGDAAILVLRAADSLPGAANDPGPVSEGGQAVTEAHRPSGVAPPEWKREALGRLVRETWVAWAREQPDPKPSWLTGWDELDEGQREVDCRIGEAVAAAERERAQAALLPAANTGLPDLAGRIADVTPPALKADWSWRNGTHGPEQEDHTVTGTDVPQPEHAPLTFERVALAEPVSGQWMEISFMGYAELTGLVTDVTIGGEPGYHIDLPDKVWGGNPLAWEEWSGKAFRSRRPVSTESVRKAWEAHKARAEEQRRQREEWEQERRALPRTLPDLDEITATCTCPGDDPGSG